MSVKLLIFQQFFTDSICALKENAVRKNHRREQISPICRSSESLEDDHGEEVEEEGEEVLTGRFMTAARASASYEDSNGPAPCRPISFTADGNRGGEHARPSEATTCQRQPARQSLVADGDVGSVGVFHADNMIAGVDVVDLARNAARKI